MQYCIIEKDLVFRLLVYGKDFKGSTSENKGMKKKPTKPKKKKNNLLVDCRKWRDDKSPAQALQKEHKTMVNSIWKLMGS